MSLKFFNAALWCVALAACGSKEAVTPPAPPPPPPPPPAAVLSVTPASVGFQDTVGSSDPAPVSASITADGGRATGVAVGTIAYGPGASGWLTASVDTNVSPTQLRLRASEAGLAPGTYTATVGVTSPMASNVASVAVTIAVWAAPPPPPTTGVVMLVAGNIARCGNVPRNDVATAALIESTPGAVFTAGDNAFQNGTAEEYANCYAPIWGRFKDRTWPVLGNHEYNTGNADGAFGYFGDRAGPVGKGYYSLDYGAWHIIVLNDNQNFVSFARDSEQARWLRDDLARSTALCTIALWHQPLFLSSNSPGYIRAPMREILWDDLYAAGADVVVNGHQHQYERMKPMAPDGSLDSLRGIRQFNVGTGGESVHLPTVAIHPNSEALAAAFGVLKLTLRPAGYDWQFMPIPGESFTDSGSGTCH